MNKRRSRLEQKFEYILNDLEIPYTYETTVIPYTIPESLHKLSLIHISEPTRQAEISYAVFCLKKKNTEQ